MECLPMIKNYDLRFTRDEGQGMNYELKITNYEDLLKPDSIRSICQRL